MDLLLKRIDATREGRECFLVDREVTVEVFLLSLQRRDLIATDLDLLLIKGTKLVVDLSIFETEIREVIVECRKVAFELRDFTVPARGCRMVYE